MSPLSIRGVELVARRPLHQESTNLLCALNHAGHRHFLVAVGDREDDLVDTQSRGLFVTTQNLEVAGEVSKRYVVIQCADSSAYDLFDAVGAELLTAILNAPETPKDDVQQVLAKWKRFWSDLPRSVMSDAEVAGLFGELWFLHVWLSPSLGASNAVRAWRGPFGARHDFESKALSIEVKTTSIASGRRHRIHGIEQLSNPEVGSLALFSLRVHREGGATNSLPVLVDAMRAALLNDSEAASVFDSALALAKYSDAFRSHYLNQTFRVADSFLFDVNESFPKITCDQLKAGALMSGVSRVEYDVDLDAIRDLALADSPETALGHLKVLNN